MAAQMTIGASRPLADQESSQREIRDRLCSGVSRQVRSHAAPISPALKAKMKRKLAVAGTMFNWGCGNPSLIELPRQVEPGGVGATCHRLRTRLEVRWSALSELRYFSFLTSTFELRPL